MPAIHTYDVTKVTFHVFDTHVRKITIADMQTVEGLVQYFEKRIEDREVYRDLYMARSILVWMSHMVNWKLKQKLPKSIKGLVDENSYPPLTFSTLCEAAHIANKTIVGKAKDVKFEPGYPYKDIPQGMWNSFLCNNTWHLVFTERAIARASGYRRGGEIVIESDGNRKFEPQQSNKGQDEAIISEFWFCISPKIMSRQAFPEDPTFQYMPMGQYLSQSDFVSCALLLPEFYRSDMTLLSENACVLQSKRGRCVINIGCPSGTLKGVEFTYKLSLIVQKGKGDACSEHIQALPRMVVFAPGMDGVTFTISLPVTGEYTFSTAIKTKTNDHNRNPECFKFKIICNEIDKYCRNIPQSVTEMGVGFTPVAKDFGLKHPSNIATTLVVKCDPDQLLASDIEVEPESVIFRVAEDRINEVEFTSEFLDDIDTIGFSEVNLDKEKGELEVKAGLKKPGESVLVVKGREIARGQDFQPILNYIVSSHEKVDDNYERWLRYIKRVNASNKKKDAKEDYKAQLQDHVIAIRKEIENLNKAVIKTHELQLKVNLEVNKEVKTTSELYEIYPTNTERGLGLTFDDSAHFQLSEFTSLPKSWQTTYSVSEGSKSAEVLTPNVFSCESDFSATEVKNSQGGKTNLHEHASTKFKAEKEYIHLKNRHMRLKNTLILEQTRVARLEQVKLKEEIAVLKLKTGYDNEEQSIQRGFGDSLNKSGSQQFLAQNGDDNHYGTHIANLKDYPDVVAVFPAYRCNDATKCKITIAVVRNTPVNSDQLINQLEDFKLKTNTDYVIKHISDFPQYDREMEVEVGNTRMDDKDKEIMHACFTKNAENLLSKHTNLSIVKGSFYKINRNLQESDIAYEPRLVLYVIAKGYIPMGEDPFDKVYDSIQVDVREGMFTMFGNHADDVLSNSRIGCKIERMVHDQSYTGTLGAFFEHPEHGFCGITCAHAILTPEEHQNCIKYGLTKTWLDHTQQMVVFQPASPHVLGHVVEIICSEGTMSNTGNDIAIIRIVDNRKPLDGKWPQPRNPIEVPVSEFTSFPKPWQTTYSVSQGSKSAEVLTYMAFSYESNYSDTEVERSPGGRTNLREHASTNFKAEKKYIHLKNRHMRRKNTLILEQTRVARLEQVKLKEEIAVLKLKRGHLEKSSYF